MISTTGFKGAPYWAALTPEDGKITLLEIFVRRRGDFHFIDPLAPANKGRASAPAENDGLSVVVRLPKATLRPDEPLKLQVVYTNLRQKALTLRGAESLWDREIQLADGKLDLPWTLRPLFQCPTNDAVIRLEPGKSFEAELTLNPNSKNYRYEFSHPIPDGKATRKMSTLAVGRYRLTVGLDFPEKDTAREAWHGKIVSKSVEFEVVADDAAQPGEKNGLAVNMEPTKKAFAAGEGLAFVITVRNTSQKPIKLKEIGSIADNTFTAADGATFKTGEWTEGRPLKENVGMFFRLSSARGNGAPPPGKDVPSVELKPGESTTFDLAFGDPRFSGFSRVGAQPAAITRDLPPGKHTVRLTLRFPPPKKLNGLQFVDAPDDAHWMGQIDATAALEVTAKK